ELLHFAQTAVNRDFTIVPFLMAGVIYLIMTLVITFFFKWLERRVSYYKGGLTLPILEVEHLKKSYGDLEVLKDISFFMEKKDVVAIVGPSGSGKSTMLRSLIQLEDINGGTIRVAGEAMVQNGTYANAQTVREITGKMGMVFQHFNLFPHLSVKQNLELAPRMQKTMPVKDIEARTIKLLKQVGLSDKLNEMPNNLSGGQK